MVEAIEIDTGKKVCFSNADCKYSYRKVNLRMSGEINMLLLMLLIVLV